MNGDNEPSITECRELSDRYEIETSSLSRVIKVLKDKGLFSSSEGSIPLYRRTLQAEMQLPITPITPTSPQSSAIAENEPINTVVPLPAGTRESTELSAIEGLPVEGNEPYNDELPPNEGLLDVKLQVTGLNTRHEGVERTMGDSREFMAKLSVTPASSPIDSQSTLNKPSDNPQSGDQPTIEERMEELEKRIQSSEESTDPLDNLSTEQIREQIKSQPQGLLAMVNPDMGNPGGRAREHCNPDRGAFP